MLYRLLIIQLLLSPIVLAESTVEPVVNQEAPVEKKDIVQSLEDIWTNILDKQKELDLLQKQLRRMKEDDAEKSTLQLQQDELMRAISKQKQSFEQVAIGGLDVEVVEQQVEPEFDWKKELVLISRPLLDNLKELTEKPRKIEQLRIEILQQENLLKSIQKAQLHIQQLLQRPNLSKSVVKQLDDIAEQWRKREIDTQSALELAHYQLTSLQENQISPQAAIVSTLHNFIHGRGLTLLIAVTIVLIILILMRIIAWIILKFYNVQSHKYQRKIRLRWARLLHYAFLTITFVLSLFAVITVFYSRNDILLLMLTVIGVLMLLVSLRNTLPRYITEIRLLLDMGAVRQGERLIYDGIPYNLLTINVFSSLSNPALDGVLRLPTNVLNNLVSRPSIADEPWFPCSQGDYILWENGQLAEVIKQTIETVQLRIMSSVVTIPTTQFIQMPIHNLSRHGFLVSVTFGVDYRHQAICLTDIPQRFETVLHEKLAQSKWAEQTKLLSVDFKEAGASSLDYLILVKADGCVASSYFAIPRFIQKICVEVCNKEDWVIPFAQLTLHAGEGFANTKAS